MMHHYHERRAKGMAATGSDDCENCITFRVEYNHLHVSSKLDMST